MEFNLSFSGIYVILKEKRFEVACMFLKTYLLLTEAMFQKLKECTEDKIMRYKEY